MNILIVMLISVTIPTILALLVELLVSISVYGNFISKEKAKKYLVLKKGQYNINSVNNDIVSLHLGGYIAKTKGSIFFKYHISGVGIVPKYSKLHKQIDKYYELLLCSKNEIRNKRLKKMLK